MKVKSKLLQLGLFVLSGIVSGVIYTELRNSNKSEVREIFMEHHKHQRDVLLKLDRDMDPLMYRLNDFEMNPTAPISIDSLKELVHRSFIVIRNCDKGLYEIEYLKKYDSLNFEFYGKWKGF